MSFSRAFLFCLFATSFILLLAFTIRASVVRSVFDNASMMQDVWFQVTLIDAYLGFIAVYVWIAWKEIALSRRVLWLVLVLIFGNMAISAYVLLQLMKLPSGRHPSEILIIRRLPSDSSFSEAQ